MRRVEEVDECRFELFWYDDEPLDCDDDDEDLLERRERFLAGREGLERFLEGLFRGLSFVLLLVFVERLIEDDEEECLVRR